MVDPSAIFAGVGALAAGIGIFRFGLARGAMQNKALQACELFIATRERIAAAEERQAAALEANAKLIPLLEAWHTQQQQNSLAMRVLSREVHELRELLREDDVGGESRH